MKPSEVIDKALTDYIPDAEHWTTGAFKRPAVYDGEDDQYCMLGAIGMAEDGHPMHYGMNGGHAFRALKEVVYEQNGGMISIMLYNDQKVRDYDEARGLMEKARANLQEKGL